MPNPAKPKRPRNRQHTVRGASWLAFAAALREKAAASGLDRQMLELIADTAEEEGKRVRKLR